MSFHVIVGAGPIGTGTALQLVDRGHQVRIITRSGSGPSHDRIELVAADATDVARLVELSEGAHSLYNCANPPYDKWPTAWPPLSASLIRAATATGARLVIMSNLYGYAENSSPMRATDPLDPPSKKGAVRAQMWRDALAAHEAGEIQATELRASDFFGPGLGQGAQLGDRVVPKALAGKNVSVVGEPDAPHSWTFVDDICVALATLGTDDRSLGRAWHAPTAPPQSARQMVTQLCQAAGVKPVKVKPVPPLMLKAMGLVVPAVGELGEMLYQFEEPFIIDATDTEETFGITYTPLDSQLEKTVAGC
ncbi:MAG: NAD-dependent epimerase/dehydratase family protein [Actinomycetia bacterium]|nr:NAD-dependent epimerase/dehydratase family protein [Actinomycetes bacterium]